MHECVECGHAAQCQLVRIEQISKVLVLSINLPCLPRCCNSAQPQSFAQFVSNKIAVDPAAHSVACSSAPGSFYSVQFAQSLTVGQAVTSAHSAPAQPAARLAVTTDAPARLAGGRRTLQEPQGDGVLVKKWQMPEPR